MMDVRLVKSPPNPLFDKEGAWPLHPFLKGRAGEGFLPALALFALLISHTAYAFYTHSTDNTHLEADGFLTIGQTALGNSDTPAALTPEDNTFTNAGFRLMTQASIGATGLEATLARGWASSDTGFTAASGFSPERSASLGWNDASHRLAFDRLFLSGDTGRVQYKLGRQPVNLATTFFFSPTDFFAPFAAQSFFREYKPGVDAARADISFGGLSQLSMIAVAGYRPDADSDTGWENGIDGSRTSWLLRLTRGNDLLEWSLLGGKVRRDNVVGGGLQTELFDWLGLRAEALFANPRDCEDDYAAWTIGLEHRWANSFDLRIEHFRNSEGADDKREYAALLSSTTALNRAVRLPYLASRYSAIAASYEFTPLITAQALAIYNHTDGSTLYTLYATWSLTDNAEMAFSAGSSTGSAEGFPVGFDEFGVYPDVVAVEVRVYF